MKKYIVFYFFILFIKLFAAVNETIPTWHWAYSFYDEIRLRGGFQKIIELNKPFTKGELAKAIILLEQELNNGEIDLSSEEIKKINRLKTLLADEVEQVLSESDYRNTIIGGLRIESYFDKAHQGKMKYQGIYRSVVNVNPHPKIAIVSAFAFDQFKVNDPNYKGKKWRGMVGNTELGYFLYRSNKFQIKFGRDFMHWGAGRSGTLFFSNKKESMDQILGHFSLGPFRYTFLTGFLDNIELEKALSDSSGDKNADRYIAAHRLNGSLFRDKIKFAVTEAVLYGGVNRNLDYIYLNPFIVYYDSELNRNIQDNKFFCFDLMTFPFPNFELYSSLLIDDIQVEKTGPGDLEPNEIGLILGMRYADPFHLFGTTIGAEYVRVTNRTYKTANPWETFILRNQPLGHPMGNDFDLWRFDVTKWFRGSLRFNLAYSAVRKGEGSIYTPWDAPWFDYTVEEGYSEPFPTGVVEKRNQFEFSVHYYPSIHWGVQGYFQSAQRSHADHIKGNNQTETSWRIGVWWDGEVNIQI